MYIICIDCTFVILVSDKSRLKVAIEGSFDSRMIQHLRRNYSLYVYDKKRNYCRFDFLTNE